jgi:hypothetical protein
VPQLAQVSHERCPTDTDASTKVIRCTVSTKQFMPDYQNLAHLAEFIHVKPPVEEALLSHDMIQMSSIMLHLFSGFRLYNHVIGSGQGVTAVRPSSKLAGRAAVIGWQ